MLTGLHLLVWGVDVVAVVEEVALTARAIDVVSQESAVAASHQVDALSAKHFWQKCAKSKFKLIELFY